MAQLDPGIFKAYDIRGVVGRTLTEDACRHIGRAFATLARREGLLAVNISRDGRLSGPALAQALAEGLRAGGVDVVDLGMNATPMLYYACATTPVTSGIQITGSHNPPEYNGLKMVLGGNALFGDQIQALRELTVSEDYAQGQGGYRESSVVDDYLGRIRGDIQLARPMKVVVDCGNGVAGAFAPRLLRSLGCKVDSPHAQAAPSLPPEGADLALGRPCCEVDRPHAQAAPSLPPEGADLALGRPCCEVIELFCEVDGTFPNHHPDPADPHNLEDLQRALRDTGAELGLAFDGDGDRLGVVTPRGDIIWPDRQIMLHARDVLERNPGAAILYDVKCTAGLAPWIRRHGGDPVMGRTGHSLIKAKMKEIDAPLAGEMSGHIFFKDRWYGFDDAQYGAARLLELLSREADAGAALESLPDAVSTPELKLHTAEGENFVLCDRLQREGRFPGAVTVSTIDGVRADYADGFGLARPSNTTPCVVLRFEGSDAAALERVQAEFRAALLALDPALQLPF